MKWLLIVLLVASLLLAWQLVEARQSAAILTSGISELGTEVVTLETQIAELEAAESAESAFYRGFVGSCVGIGVKQSVPSDIISATCNLYMDEAYKGDFYHELMPDNWVWPPVAD